jgi:signal peptidase II
MRLLLLLTLPLYILDQITKFLVLANIPTHVSIEVIPGFFNLVQVHNTGAAFGMLKDNNWFFIGLASVALIAVAVMANACSTAMSWISSM